MNPLLQPINQPNLNPPLEQKEGLFGWLKRSSKASKESVCKSKEKIENVRNAQKQKPAVIKQVVNDIPGYNFQVIQGGQKRGQVVLAELPKEIPMAEPPKKQVPIVNKQAVELAEIKEGREKEELPAAAVVLVVEKPEGQNPAARKDQPKQEEKVLMPEIALVYDLDCLQTEAHQIERGLQRVLQVKIQRFYRRQFYESH